MNELIAEGMESLLAILRSIPRQEMKRIEQVAVDAAPPDGNSLWLFRITWRAGQHDREFAAYLDAESVERINARCLHSIR